jgi:hypothetical protein
VPATHRPGIQIIIWINNHDIDLLDFVFVYQLTEITVDVFVYQLTEISVDVFVYQLTEISVDVFVYQLTEISVDVFVYFFNIQDIDKSLSPLMRHYRI